MSKIEVVCTMFRDFTITCEKQCIKEDDFKSDKLMKLSAYLIFNHKRQVPNQELIDFIWYEEDIDNPIGALKNLVYRLRTVLKKMNLNQMICTGKGTYYISEDYHMTIDIEKYEAYDMKIDRLDKNEDDYKNFIHLYKGEFLPKIDTNSRIQAKKTYYRSRFIARTIEYCQLLEKKGNYSGMEKVANYAISIVELEEELYIQLIKALYLQKEYKSAIRTYAHIIESLYNVLGVAPSKDLKALYETIQKENHDTIDNIIDVKEDLGEGISRGAMYCEYGAFRNVYTMQARMLERLGVVAHLCLLTIIDDGNVDEVEKKEAYMKKTMDRIQGMLTEGLRANDTFARYSQNQYVVLLAMCDYEDTYFVMDRVLQKIKRNLNNKDIRIDLSVQEVEMKD